MMSRSSECGAPESGARYPQGWCNCCFWSIANVLEEPHEPTPGSPRSVVFAHVVSFVRSGEGLPNEREGLPNGREGFCQRMQSNKRLPERRFLIRSWTRISHVELVLLSTAMLTTLQFEEEDEVDFQPEQEYYGDHSDIRDIVIDDVTMDEARDPSLAEQEEPESMDDSDYFKVFRLAEDEDAAVRQIWKEEDMDTFASTRGFVSSRPASLFKRVDLIKERLESPVSPSSPRSLLAVMLGLVDNIIGHRLAWSSLDGTLRSMRFAMPNSSLPKSATTFRLYLRVYFNKAIRFAICPGAHCGLGLLRLPTSDPHASCKKCKSRFLGSTGKPAGGIFYYLPLWPRLRKLFSVPALATHARYPWTRTKPGMTVLFLGMCTHAHDQMGNHDTFRLS
eukprot:TRINITY_DN10493_c0_g1_i1.p1 TRINITY_DN10493_c0_g1~~TRINITY_DN10493_c0_g1_i1.p1  ORF type:complete len:392 (+),score=-1.96 TRINITY_DN10493_c0_g1_i1:3-1178(+)